ncbi:hypothetical protein MLD38_011502 [Melastoma candidum]|uniref:Uncharacterized protein n=1 Tax=Melastoma candidum TaxID=119954 RepID=A0ACB9R698_9MYRT|nr:hypothetical protein MLD38_011502 [Melastoma candidum]
MEGISQFCSLVRQRRFDDVTLGFLQSLLVAKDVKSSSEIRSGLRLFLRSESPLILREFADQSIDRVLVVLEFLVQATALMSDIEEIISPILPRSSSR